MTIELGLALAIDAQSFGQPGQRTFRLRVRGAASEAVSLWVEKEYLQALTLALRQLLSQLGHEGEAETADVGDFPEVADHEFRVGRLGMGVDPSERTVMLQLHEVGIDEEAEPTLRFSLALAQCASLAAQMDDIIVRGRPICPLCGLPVDAAGHRCVRSNGHSVEPIPGPDTDQEGA